MWSPSTFCHHEEIHRKICLSDSPPFSENELSLLISPNFLAMSLISSFATPYEVMKMLTKEVISFKHLPAIILSLSCIFKSPLSNACFPSAWACLSFSHSKILNPTSPLTSKISPLSSRLLKKASPFPLLLLDLLDMVMIDLLIAKSNIFVF